MRFHDWISNIRWKYFTNSKSGLIFKELMKEFRMVEQMTENKRFEWCEEIKGNFVDEYVKDNITGKSLDEEDMFHLLNEQEERIQELENELELYKHYVEFVPSSGDV